MRRDLSFVVLRKASPDVRRLNEHLVTEPQAGPAVSGPAPVTASAGGVAPSNPVITTGVLPSADINPVPTWGVGHGTFVIPCIPMGAPRMTRADAWRKRPCVVRYNEYKAIIRSIVGEIIMIPDAINMRFFLPMPPSWSEKKKAAMCHKGHRSKPDIDNLEKGLMDALLKDDAGVWRTNKVKLWDYQSVARVELEIIYDTETKTQ